MVPRPESGQKRPELEELLEQSIEDGLREVLGPSGLQMVLSHYPMARLSTEPEAFHEVLEGIFMENGAAIIEREIGRRLLDRMGADKAGEGRLHRWWLATAALSKKGPGQASAREKKVLRQFVALSTLPKSHSAGAKLGDASGTTSIDLTSARFASAFKKVS